MNTHLKQLWAAMKLPKNFKKSYKFFCLGLDIRVTQIMESDWTQTVFAQDVAEVSAYIIWINKIPHIVYTDVLQIFFTIASAALLALLFLTGFRCNQCGFNLRYQRQCAEAGIVLCPFFGYIYRLSVHIDTLECVRNSDSFIYKVNGRPLQPKRFAIEQTFGNE